MQSLVILIPCVLWFLYYNRQLATCGSAVPSGAGQCSAVITRFLSSLAGLIVSGLLAIGASMALAAAVIRARR